MSKKKTVSDGADDISINIFYSIKGSKKTRRLSLTPKEYFWRLTKRETRIITSTASRENGKYPIDAEIPDFCAVYSRDEDELYDIARVDGDFNKIDKENQVRFYRVLARNDDKKIIEIERKVKWEKLLK